MLRIEVQKLLEEYSEKISLSQQPEEKCIIAFKSYFNETSEDKMYLSAFIRSTQGQPYADIFIGPFFNTTLDASFVFKKIKNAENNTPFPRPLKDSIDDKKIVKFCMTPFLNAKDIHHLSFAAKFFLEIRESKTFKCYIEKENYKKKFLSMGCNQTIVNEIMATTIIRDFKNLEMTLLQIPQYVANIKESWELYCMSGEPDAIEFVVTQLKITAAKVNFWGENILHLAVFSGKIAAVKKVAALCPTIDFNAIAKRWGSNLLHLAAWRGNSDMIYYLRYLAHINKLHFTPEAINHNGYSSFNIANIHIMDDNLKNSAIKALSMSIIQVLAQAIIQEEINHSPTIYNDPTPSKQKRKPIDNNEEKTRKRHKR